MRLWGNLNAGAETSCGQSATGPSRVHDSATVLLVRLRLLSLMWQTVKWSMLVPSLCRVLLSIHSHLQRICTCVHVCARACFFMRVRMRVTVHPVILNTANTECRVCVCVCTHPGIDR